jgi:hypothetical protein
MKAYRLWHDDFRARFGREPVFYHVRSVADLHGYKDVEITWIADPSQRKLFGPDGSLGIPYEEAVSCYDGDQYSEFAVDELFTEDEAKQLIEWVRSRRGDATATLIPVELPVQPNEMPFYAIPSGGGPDFLMISDSDDYDLPFKAKGFHDVRGYKFDASAPDARRAFQGFRIQDGKYSPGYWKMMRSKGRPRAGEAGWGTSGAPTRTKQKEGENTMMDIGPIHPHGRSMQCGVRPPTSVREMPRGTGQF